MKNDMRAPRSGAAVAFLCAATAVIWAIAAYGTYTENKREKYDVSIKPGAVSYGTLSTATIPVVATTTHRSSVPMVSAGAVHNYAYYGHSGVSTSGSSAGGYRMHTTSSATVHNIGAGGSGGGGGMGSSRGGSSSRGLGSGGASVSISMPTLAVNTSRLATPTYEVDENVPKSIGPRRVAPADPDDPKEGMAGQDTEDPNKWWIWDDEEGGWREAQENDSRTDAAGNIYEFHDGAWVLTIPAQGQGDPGLPVGATPWLLMLLLAAAYEAKKKLDRYAVRS